MSAAARPRLPRLLAALAVLAWLAAAAAPAAAASAEAAAEYVESLGNRAIDQLADAGASQAERERRFRALLNEGFAVPAISRFVLGRYWRAATEAEREAFQDAFERVLVQRFLPLFAEYSGEDFAVASAEPAPNAEATYLVDTLVRRPGAEDKVRVRWRVREREARLQIVDVMAEGVSMAITLRSEYGSVIQRQGGRVAALVDLLEEKLAAGAFRPQEAADIAK